MGESRGRDRFGTALSSGPGLFLQVDRFGADEVGQSAWFAQRWWWAARWPLPSLRGTSIRIFAGSFADFRFTQDSYFVSFREVSVSSWIVYLRFQSTRATK